MSKALNTKYKVLNTQYNPSEIELKWQTKWEEAKLYQPDLASANGSAGSPQGRPYYNLHMFPYPSAEGLHVGNVYAFTGADIYGRFKRMQGYDVFQPFGLDGFGIHSENYALKVGTHPMDQAEKSEGRFYAQVKALGSGYDWSRTLETYDSDYYRWTQWLFIQLFKSGLAYRESVAVNFCPSCKTVLADEQVIQKDFRGSKPSNQPILGVEPLPAGSVGVCERCDTVVEKKDLEQWMFRITEYAEQLLSGLDKIDWTEKVKIAQRNWIGKSEGAKITFTINDEGLKNNEIEVFTTRPDTLYGATFLVLSPEHPFVASLLNGKWQMANGKSEKIRDYVEQAKSKEDSFEKDVTGVFSGAYAINPINNEQIPIWIADYVLMSYGTGAIMAVPAHDERDYEFAKKYDLSIQHVVMPSIIDPVNSPYEGKENTKRKTVIAVVRNSTNGKYLCLKWKDQEWTTFVTGGVEENEDPIEAAKREVIEETGYTDIKAVRVLGGPTEAFYYAAHKGVNRQTRTQIVLLDLISESQAEVLEQEKAQHEPIWLTEEEVVGVKLRHSELSLIMERIKTGNDAYTGDGVLINSGEWDGLSVEEAKKRAIEDLERIGVGEKKTTYHLRDWLISRQRYWGPPIPMIYCQSCAEAGKSWFTSKEGASSKYLVARETPLTTNYQPLATKMAGWYPEEKLPVLLPHIDDYKPSAEQNSQKEGVRSPLGNHPEFYNVVCPECGSAARRETDVSDTFLDSSWYFLRYLATDFKDLPFPMSEESTRSVISSSANQSERSSSADFSRPMDDRNDKVIADEIVQAEKRQAWLPVTMYTGGAEHSVLHLLYTRFFYKVLFDLGYISAKGRARGDEPFPRFYAHGLIIKDGSKMSKSKGNVVAPDEYVKKFGADTLRAYLMFLGPFDMGGDFRDSGIEGMNRFIKRVWTLLTSQTISGTDMSISANSASSLQAKSAMNEAIKGVTEDIESLKYNTAIAKIMTYYNFLSKKEEITIVETVTLLKLLAPFAPHMTEELYQRLRLSQNIAELKTQKDADGVVSRSVQLSSAFQSIHTSPWPVFDVAAIEQGETVIAVQVNGKLRGTLRPSSPQSGRQAGQALKEEDVVVLAKEQESVAKHLEGKTIKKVIYVPGKILNFVVT